MKTRKFKKAKKKFFGHRPSPAYLKVRDDRTPRPPPPSPLSEGLDPPLYNWSLIRVVFKLGSKVNCVCYGFATPHGDWLFDKTRATFPAKEK